MKNPLIKRLPRELKTDAAKYLVVFLFMTISIGLVSGALVAGNSMINAYQNSFDKYNVEDGNFAVHEQLSKAQITELEKERRNQCHLVNQFQIKIQWFSFRESHCFFSSKT